MYKDFLISCVKQFNAEVGNSLFLDNKFEIWSGSSKAHHHHYGKTGLIKHTAEVVQLALNCNKTISSNVNERELFLACLFHDSGKTYDYEPIDEYFAEWKETDHKKKIHHISRSAMIWNQFANQHNESQETIDNVLHAILAHHGSRDWGSPVTPLTKLAWMLHLCDGISARMDDAEKHV